MSREMVNSGIPWIGEIPKHWANAKYRYSGVFVKGKLPNEQNVEQLGKPIIGASEMLGKECRNFSLDTNVPTCQKQDVLILWDGANAGIVANNCEGIVSSTAVKYMCTDRRFDSQYLFYLFKNGEPFFKSKVNGTTIPHMNQKYIDEYLCIQPPLSEQQKIASFLDRKCAEIDEMIALQEKIVEELKAYKQSLITETVIKGLNPNAEMKDSGIEWIGKIPVHWKICKNRYLFKENVRKCNGTEISLSLSQADGLVPTAEMKENAMKSSSYENWKAVKVDDIVLNRFKAHLGVLFRAKLEGMVSFHYGVYEAITELYPQYFEYLYHSDNYRYVYSIMSNGMVVGLQNLSNTNFYRVDCVVPTLEEQIQISDYLDTKCTEIDNLISIKLSKIDSLKEYKKSIIYEYVTGKREVE